MITTTKIQAAARKALITAAPEYFAWSAQQQEQFRATMSEAAQNKVDAVLLNEVLGIQCTAENAGEIWRDLPLSKLNNLNWAKILTTGIGEDYIFLNESMAEGESLLDFKTLYEYDFVDHLFQEQANKEELKNGEERDYYALRFSRWARLIIDDQFYYATLYSLASYLIETIEDKGDDIIQALIPHDYVYGKDHGKQETGGVLWDMQVDAAGKERQLAELKGCWYSHLQQRWLELSRQFSQYPPAAYMEDKSEQNELHRNFIFNNEGALRNIRWRHFLQDCQAIKTDYADVAEMEQQELDKAENWLKATHQDIINNFDPDVIEFKKKRKIIIAPGAFDGMMGEDGDE